MDSMVITQDVAFTNKAATEVDWDVCSDRSPTDGNIFSAQEEQPAKVPIINRIKGISLFVLVSFLATCEGAFVKQMKVLPTGEVVMITGLYAICLLGTILTFQGISILTFPNKRWVLLRCIGGCGALIGKFWSVQNLPLGNAIALVFTSPIMTCVLARVFLKEKINLFHIFAIVVGLIGIILIAKPTFIFPSDDPAEAPLWYNAVPLVAALSLSIAYVCQRHVGSVVSCTVVSFYGVLSQSVAALILQSATSSQYINPPCYSVRWMLPFCGYLSAALFLAVNKGLYYEKAATVSLIRNLDTVLAFFLQVVVFRETAETMSLIGAALIMLGTLSMTFSKIFGVDCGVRL